MSPKATLERGYSILVGPDGDAVGSVATIDVGDDLLAYLADGQLVVEVRETRPAGRSSMNAPTPEPSMSYEAAREELIQVVQRLESGGAPLDESLALWERGEQLAAICQAWLDGAKTRVEAARPAKE